MKPIDILKAKISSVKLSESVNIKDSLRIKLITKEEIEKDAKKVRQTFKDEDLQPRITTI